jgi:hypothetical protein
LSERPGFQFRELLPRFHRQRLHVTVPEIIIEREIAHATHTIRLCPLSLEVAGVFDFQIRGDERLVIEISALPYCVEQGPKRDILTARHFDDFFGLQEFSASSG